MKKLLCLLLAFVFIFLVSCTEPEKSESSESESSAVESKEQSIESESKEPESSEESSKESSEEAKDDPLTLADCETHVVRTKAYSEKSDFFKKALNSEKLSIEGGHDLPIYRIESVDDVNRVGQILKDSYEYGGVYHEDIAFKNVMKNTDDEFFQTTTVFLTYFLSGTGSFRFLVTDIDEDGTFTVAQKEYLYDIVTDDLAGWLFFVFAPKEKADKLTEVNAVYSTEVYKEGEKDNISVEELLSFSDCETHTAWANSCDISELYKNALNSEKLLSSGYPTGINLPIYKFESMEDVNNFKENFKGLLSFDGSYDEVPSFNKVMENADEDFFQATTVFVTYIFSGTGSFRYHVTDVNKDGTFIVEQQDYPYEEVTDDEAGWFLFVFAPKEKADKLTEINAVFSAKLSPLVNFVPLS
ncbi:MAG: hypothetical protein E7614_04695 [Ruminococcaceae bacterium]|nr:hypothetical protein [Oscillospiraceae bacterium]